MIPLFTSEQVRAADNYAVKELKIPGEILMENASISIVNAIFEKYPYVDSSFKFGIVCGKGNNGGDGLALARQLLIRGFNVAVVSLGNEKSLKGDALANYKILQNFIIDYENSSLIHYSKPTDLKSILKCEIIIDALLGTGLNGELKDPYHQIIEKLNQAESLRIAIDTPTGLVLNNASGDVIFDANFTVTLAALKTGLYYEQGRIHSGEIVSGSIGIGEKYFDDIETNEFLVEPEDIVRYLPKKLTNIHKYSAGKVLAIAGSEKLPGAAFYCMNAAMISGTGAGLLAFPKSLKSFAQSNMNSAVVVEYKDEGNGYLASNNLKELSEDIEWADAIALGPGLGNISETRDAVIELLKKYPKSSFVIDADAITALSNGEFKKLNLENKVLTPHHAEFANLLGIKVDELKSNLLKLAKQFCHETGSYLVLKGAPTIIFNPEGESIINTTGNAGLAKFGSGDVLTGMIASFISQHDDIEESIIAAVYLHGLSADIIMKRESEYGLIPKKLIDQIPKSIKFLRKSVV